MKDLLFDQFESSKIEETDCLVGGADCNSTQTNCFGDQCTETITDYNGKWGEATGDNWVEEDPCAE